LAGKVIEKAKVKMRYSENEVFEKEVKNHFGNSNVVCAAVEQKQATQKLKFADCVVA